MWRTIILTLCISLFLTACGFGGSDAPPTPPPQPVELSLVSIDNISVAEDALIDKYEETHPGFTIKTNPLSQPPALYLSEPQPPDLLFMVPGGELPTLIAEGLVTDITDLWDEGGFGTAYPAALRSLTERDGKQFFLPTGYAWNAIYYNKQVFQQYNLQPPRTWEELITICDTLLLNNEVPFAMSGEDFFMTALWVDYLSLRLNGPEVHRQFLNGEISYTDERISEVFVRWQYLLDQGYVNRAARNFSTLEAHMALVRDDQGLLGNDKAVMALTGPVFLSQMPNKFRQELDFFPFPAITPGLPAAEVVFATGYVIPTEAKQRSEALTFLEFLASAEARTILQKEVSSGGIYAPAFSLADGEALPPAIQQGVEHVRNAPEILTPYLLNLDPALFFPVGDLFQKLIESPTASKPINLTELLQSIEDARNK